MEASPFKFLDAYERNDAGRFFGRKRETAQLYNAVFSSRLTLLYGGSGTGKTSLVQCGLGNKFYDTDWLPVAVRRGQDINASLRLAAAAHLSPERAEESDGADRPAAEILQLLYLDHFKAVYLIFDQFEELFIEGGAEEQAIFYNTIRDLLQGDRQVKVLIVMREEWLGHLSAFERVVPALFDNRLRIERMRDSVLWRTVIPGMVRAAGIELRDPRVTIPLIVDQIRDPREGVDLTDLQVYLDRLYRRARQEQAPAEGRPPYFDPDLVRAVGEIRNVLSVFLDEQLERLEQRLREQFRLENPENIPLDILFTLVTNEQTKRALPVDAILDQLPPHPGLTREAVEFCVREMTNLRLLNLMEG